MLTHFKKSTEATDLLVSKIIGSIDQNDLSFAGVSDGCMALLLEENVPSEFRDVNWHFKSLIRWVVDGSDSLQLTNIVLGLRKNLIKCFKLEPEKAEAAVVYSVGLIRIKKIEIESEMATNLKPKTCAHLTLLKR
jgi:hypothetical protein